jgi:hypothetical protein
MRGVEKTHVLGLILGGFAPLTRRKAWRIYSLDAVKQTDVLKSTQGLMFQEAKAGFV